MQAVRYLFNKESPLEDALKPVGLLDGVRCLPNNWDFLLKGVKHIEYTDQTYSNMFNHKLTMHYSVHEVHTLSSKTNIYSATYTAIVD